MSTKDLEKAFYNHKNGETIGKIINNELDVDVIKNNNAISISFAKHFDSVELLKGLGDNRTRNLVEACELLKAKWINDINTMPKDIYDEMVKMFPKETLETMSGNQLLSVIRKSEWVLHENIDLKTVSLVPRMFHDKVNGYSGISHLGGFSVAKYYKSTIIGKTFFENLVQVAGNGGIFAN